ncbi:protein kintoun [Teleopsis dalmanni]|uniref:protein kintoun n=1 Tax=Teleopsis dalmanni TaxID=139649 RepID=UPI0018CCF54F|nr:protein kintoun [Teleopsis dalmanni]
MSAITEKATHNKHCQSKKKSSEPQINITKQEFDLISDAFKKEEFRKLFFDYCEEIQDPENRKIYEKEITQFEAERGVNITFVNPEPGFVVKTSVDGKLKCFINIAQNGAIGEPKSEPSNNPETGKRCTSWSLPLAQGPPRDDLDAKNNRCRIFDVVYHPNALQLANRNSEFRKFVIDTALDAVEREFEVDLDRNNLKYPKLKYKGIARPTVIRKLAENAPPENLEPHPLESIYPPKPTADSASPKVIKVQSKSKLQTEFTTPKYVIKHRRDVDLTEFTDELDAKLNVTIPRELIIEIELPLLNSTADCELDVSENLLYLLSKRPGAKYYLNLDLPYTVRDKDGVARFDVDTRKLCVTLPVVQQSVKKQRDMHDMLIHLNREDSGVESDIRDESNSNRESPVEELSEKFPGLMIKDNEKVIEKEVEDTAVNSTSHTEPFLKSTIEYAFPSKFDCNVLDNCLSLVLHVKNVQSDSILLEKHNQNAHLQFCSIGSGFYPTYYAFFIQLPNNCNIKIKDVQAEAWENNLVLSINLTAPCENLHNYLAGLDVSDLKEYEIHDKFKAPKNRKRKNQIIAPTTLAASLDVSVERSECERAIEIEIKPRVEHQSTCATNTTEDDDDITSENGVNQQLNKKLNKKQKKKTKKQRSLSETAYDDIKAFEKQQEQQQQQEKKTIQKSQVQIKRSDCKIEDDNSSPERNEEQIITTSTTSSVDVPNLNSTGQQRKARSFSECRADSGVSCSAGSANLQANCKGILKHYSRYATRPSISDSCSSIDDNSLYSCSVDAIQTHSLNGSRSFSDIPEEQPGLSESCKKTVRFNEVIRKQTYRYDSSILGQRKKNQKRRDRKQRALQRRLSEGDSADYEDNKPIIDCSSRRSQTPRHMPGGALYESIENDMEHSMKPRERFESESSEVDAVKNSMIFEMDM